MTHRAAASCRRWYGLDAVVITALTVAISLALAGVEPRPRDDGGDEGGDGGQGEEPGGQAGGGGDGGDEQGSGEVAAFAADFGGVHGLAEVAFGGGAREAGEGQRG